MSNYLSLCKTKKAELFHLSNLVLEYYHAMAKTQFKISLKKQLLACCSCRARPQCPCAARPARCSSRTPTGNLTSAARTSRSAQQSCRQQRNLNVAVSVIPAHFKDPPQACVPSPHTLPGQVTPATDEEVTPAYLGAGQGVFSNV